MNKVYGEMIKTYFLFCSREGTLSFGLMRVGCQPDVKNWVQKQKSGRYKDLCTCQSKLQIAKQQYIQSNIRNPQHTKNMFVVALLILYLLLAIPLFLRHQKHTCSVLAHRIAHNWSGIDRSLRCIQYVLVLVVGVLETTASDTAGYRSLLLVAYAHQLAFAATTVSRCRKALRFWRGKLLIQSLRECLTGIDQQQPLKSAENVLVGAATVGDVVFYLTDHYSLLYVLGVVTHHDRLTFYDLVGNWAWVFSSVIMVMVGLLRVYHLLKVQQGKQGKRQMSLVMMDIVRNCVEIVMGHFFIYPHLASKTTRGVTALVAVSLGLARFDYL